MITVRSTPLNQHHIAVLCRTHQYLTVIARNVAADIASSTRKKSVNTLLFASPDRTIGQELTEKHARSSLINTPFPLLIPAKTSAQRTAHFISASDQDVLAKFMDKKFPDRYHAASSHLKTTSFQLGCADPYQLHLWSISSLKDLQPTDIKQLFSVLSQNTQAHEPLHGFCDNQQTVILMLAIELFLHCENLLSDKKIPIEQAIIDAFPEQLIPYQLKEAELTLAIEIALKLAIYEITETLTEKFSATDVAKHGTGKDSLLQWQQNTITSRALLVTNMQSLTEDFQQKLSQLFTLEDSLYATLSFVPRRPVLSKKSRDPADALPRTSTTSLSSSSTRTTVTSGKPIIAKKARSTQRAKSSVSTQAQTLPVALSLPSLTMTLSDNDQEDLAWLTSSDSTKKQPVLPSPAAKKAPSSILPSARSLQSLSSSPTPSSKVQANSTPRKFTRAPEAPTSPIPSQATVPVTPHSELRRRITRKEEEQKSTQAELERIKAELRAAQEQQRLTATRLEQANNRASTDDAVPNDNPSPPSGGPPPPPPPLPPPGSFDKKTKSIALIVAERKALAAGRPPPTEADLKSADHGKIADAIKNNSEASPGGTLHFKFKKKVRDAPPLLPSSKSEPAIGQNGHAFFPTLRGRGTKGTERGAHSTSAEKPVFPTLRATGRGTKGTERGTQTTSPKQLAFPKLRATGRGTREAKSDIPSANNEQPTLPKLRPTGRGALKKRATSTTQIATSNSVDEPTIKKHGLQ